jgi:aryl-alcohol dehydrogenase-like predicted oxidoreductase
VGGWHLGLKKVDEALSIKIIHASIDAGINFMDNSWDYNDGLSEIRMGKALQNGKRDKVFLMTKIDGRSKKEAQKQLDESLKRMKVDMIDLVQHHEVIRFEDPQRIFDEDGANQALLEARTAGKILFIGFTGHKDPQIHLHALGVAKENNFRFDAVQMPLNLMDAHFRSFEKLVLPELVKEKIAVLGMKCMGNGALLQSKTVTAPECLRYALNLPTSVVITGMDSMEVLHQALDVVKSLEPLTAAAINALLEKTREAATHGYYEPFKTTSLYDSTASNPIWLGEESAKKRKEMMPQG